MGEFSIPPCSTCPSRGGIFKVLDGVICFLCLDYMRYKSHYSMEELYNLSCDAIKKVIAATRLAEEELRENPDQGKSSRRRT